MPDKDRHCCRLLIPPQCNLILLTAAGNNHLIGSSKRFATLEGSPAPRGCMEMPASCAEMVANALPCGTAGSPGVASNSCTDTSWLHASPSRHTCMPLDCLSTYPILSQKVRKEVSGKVTTCYHLPLRLSIGSMVFRLLCNPG